DLALLDKDYETWSQEALEVARSADARPHAEPWLEFLATLNPDVPDRAAEAAAIEGAAKFTAYLRAFRDARGRSTVVGPGRFLLPGELEGSPLVSFCPLPPPAAGARAERNSLRRLMRDRYEAYKSQVVGGFHRRHFARLDSQVVLVDIAGHASWGGAALEPVARSLDSVLRALRIGSGGWLPRWISPRIEKVLFAASKADQVPTDQHEALDALLRKSLDESIRRTSYQGARLEAFSIAAIRATREVVAASEQDRRYVAGRTVGEERDVAHFPGRIDLSGRPQGTFEVVRFLPPPGLDPAGPWPHLRLDRAIETLIGDRLRRASRTTGRAAGPWTSWSRTTSRAGRPPAPPRTACRSKRPCRPPNPGSPVRGTPLCPRAGAGVADFSWPASGSSSPAPAPPCWRRSSATPSPA